MISNNLQICATALILLSGTPAAAAPALKAASATTPVSSANRQALRQPAASRFTNARQVYAWSDGATYRLFALPERITDIALEPGEKLVSVAAGDTSRWMIGDTLSGHGQGEQVHILVKPTAPGLRTNMIITTDRRSYHLELDSQSAVALAAISWTYPKAGLIALHTAKTSGPPLPAPLPVPFDPASLDFAYEISGDRPDWRPMLAFDDGRQTFIQFPASIGQGSAPPLFLVGKDGRSELVNYRMRGTYYVVDRLFELAELRLGEKRQIVVRIGRVSGHARP